jgi:Uma2 family endonuclease
MGMAHPIGGWTVADVLALPDDGKRYEVVDGELLVTPAPSVPHQRAITELMRLLLPYIGAQVPGFLFTSPADIELDERTLVQPDIFVAPPVDGRPPRRWSEVRSLPLAIEILSPSTARADRHLKRRRYQRHGVAQYWIVDLDARLIERWRPDDERADLLAERLIWQPQDAEAPLELDLVAFFRQVWND